MSMLNTLRFTPSRRHSTKLRRRSWRSRPRNRRPRNTRRRMATKSLLRSRPPRSRKRLLRLPLMPSIKPTSRQTRLKSRSTNSSNSRRKLLNRPRRTKLSRKMPPKSPLNLPRMPLRLPPLLPRTSSQSR